MDSIGVLRARLAALRCGNGGTEDREYAVTERAAIVSVLLLFDALTIDQGISTARIADACYMSESGAYKMMCRIARVQPIIYADGVWRWLTD